MSLGWPEHTMAIPCRVMRASRAIDPYGSDRPDWDHPVLEAPTVCWMQAMGGGTVDSETLVDRDEVRVDLRVWLPAGTDVTGRDRLVIDEETFEVIGPPYRPRAPWANREHHVRLEARRVTGPGSIRYEAVHPVQPVEPPAEPEEVV